jgi:cytochrome P450
MVLQSYVPQWRTIRKIMHGILNARNADIFAPFHDVESRQLVFDVLREPDRWWRANQRFANNVIMSVVFGKRVSGERKSEGEEKSNVGKLFDTSRELSRRRIPVRCASSFLEDPENGKLGETQRLFALGSRMEAGSDTSRMTLSQIVAAATTERRWVKETQKALDRACGISARLPESSDREKLPYLSAVVKEGLRSRLFAKIGMWPGRFSVIHHRCEMPHTDMDVQTLIVADPRSGYVLYAH